MRYGIIALIALVLPSACTEAPSKVAATSKRLILPDVVEYPKEVQRKAADEMIGGRCPVISDVFMPDYGVMRDQTRVAKKELK